MGKLLLYVFALECALAIAGTAQVDEWTGCGRPPADYMLAGTGSPDKEPIPTHFLVTSLLKGDGIALTENSLLAALHSDKAEIRFLAAWQLADQDAKNAIPDIADALKVERTPRAKAYMACALIELGDQRGIEALHQYCKDPDFPVDVKLDVADFLLEVHEPSCPKAVVEGLATNFGLTASLQAQATMERFYDTSPSQYADLRALLLNDSNGGVKQDALNEIRSPGDTAAIPDLQAAIIKESDDLLRAEMELVLRALQDMKR